MAPISPKRRKLDHVAHNSPAADQKELGNASDKKQDSSQSSDEASLHSKPQAPQKRSHDDHDAEAYAGGSYKSNLFKLQVDELLAAVRPNYEKQLNGADAALHKLKGLIEEIVERDAVSVVEATKSFQKSHNITIPFPEPKPDKAAAYNFGYARPSNINIVGSYALKTMVKSNDGLSIDMVVTMPASIFTEKDYLNYRYFYKRAYYLACIAAGLQNNAQNNFTFSFEHLHGNDLQTILVAKSKSEPTIVIRIIPAAPQALFTGLKLLPSKNALRPNEASGNDLAIRLPTPFYNASLQSDINFESNLKLLHASAKQSPGFKDACALGRVWLQQRGFASRLSKGGFGQFEWSALMALLLKDGGHKGHSVLSPGYSSYQMFKATLQFLSATDLSAKPLIIGTTNFTISRSSMPMLYDGQRGQNLLYKMSPWSYSLLREEASTSLEMLNDAAFDQFEATFILKTSQPLQRYDCVIRLSPSPTTDIPARTHQPVSCDHIAKSRQTSNRVFEVLREGLTDRVTLINIEVADLTSWSTNENSPSLPDSSIMASVAFNAANIDRLVDHGPSAAEKKKALAFQKFWGEKAEMRRFKDGSILETLVWSPGSGYDVLREIVTYLIRRHIGVEVSSSLTFIGEGFNKMLPGPGISTKHFESLNQAFGVLRQQVRDLEGLPLQLRQLSPIDPQLRYSSIHVPSYSSAQPMKKPADVLIQFEGSGRWPDDVLAIQRTKIAFLLKIGSLLQEADPTTTTKVGLENEDSGLQNCAFLDIVYATGATFRLRIHNDREQTLLERQRDSRTSDSRTREDAVSALSAYQRIFIQLPLLNQSISTYCTRFPILSPTIRIMKLWFSRHQLLGHISEEFVELLVMHTFLQPYPWRAPSSVMTGFLRSLLFISKWDWRQDPLIVDFTGSMDSTEAGKIDTRLAAYRKIDPSMNKFVLIAASNHDMTGIAHTGKGPSKLIASRMTALARSACKLVKEQCLGLDQRSLFTTSTSDYDLVVHLAPRFVSEDRQSSTKSKYKNLAMQADSNTGLLGYQPVDLFLAELERLYTNSIIFFYGSSGSTIVGLWNPQASTARGFRVNMPYATKVADNEGEVVVDKDAVLAEIARLGGDMIERVEIKRT